MMIAATTAMDVGTTMGVAMTSTMIDDQQPVQRGGLGGLIDNVLGGGGLRVGQRAPANLNGLPSAYRSQYRDGNGVYYRSDGRSIYGIDTRSQEVIGIYPMNR